MAEGIEANEGVVVAVNAVNAVAEVAVVLKVVLHLEEDVVGETIKVGEEQEVVTVVVVEGVVVGVVVHKQLMWTTRRHSLHLVKGMLK